MPASPPNVAGVVLAAGSSTRMGTNKMLLEVGGEALVRRTVRTVGEAGLDPVVVVLGHQAERVEAQLAGLFFLPTVNPHHGRGAGASLRVGVNQVAGAAALVLCLADMPLVTASMLSALIERYRQTQARLVVSRYGDVEAPPHLFDHSLFPELLSGEDEQGAKSVIVRHLKEASILEWPRSGLQDVDVPSDMDQVRETLSGRTAP